MAILLQEIFFSLSLNTWYLNQLCQFNSLLIWGYFLYIFFLVYEKTAYKQSRKLKSNPRVMDFLVGKDNITKI